MNHSEAIAQGLIVLAFVFTLGFLAVIVYCLDTGAIDRWMDGANERERQARADGEDRWKHPYDRS